MGTADYVMRTNALGTINVNEAFHAAAGEGAVIVNVASMAAYLIPPEILPTEQFPLAVNDADAFINAMIGGVRHHSRGDAVRACLRGEQELRALVQRVPG